MSSKAYFLLNQLPNVENFSYLELGLGKRTNFDRTNCVNKKSVDTSSKFGPTYLMTTDDYFEKIEKENFDVIFIDACHDFEYALRDFNNSISRCNKFIMMHDMYPPTLRHTERVACSDSYKILFYLLKETNFEIAVLDRDAGLTFIKMPAHSISIPDFYKNATYEQFIEFMKTQKIFTPEEIVKRVISWLQ
jgi:hypothetical protein